VHVRICGSPGWATARGDPAADLEDPDTFCIVEEWELAEALRRHFGTPHMAAFQSRIPELVAGPPAIRFYEATAANPLA